VPDDLAQYDELAHAYETLAQATDLLAELAPNAEAHGEAFHQALELAAEAQSAVRAALGPFGGRRGKNEDHDKLFQWLKTTAAERHIYIRRFMTLDDPADPKKWPDLQARLRTFADRLHAARLRDKQQRNLFSKLRYHLKRIADTPEADHAHDWNRIGAVAGELVAGGLPPSNRELRELLLPVLDDLPDDLEAPPEFSAVLRELDRYLAHQPAAVRPKTAAPTPAVREAARLLRGKTVLLIGGEPRPGAAAALESALNLAELIWADTRAHQTHIVFEADVARPDVALVLLAIRWSSHGFGEVKEYCDRYGKPLVRLPGGYNPNQVAYQILEQVGDRLRSRSPVTASGVN
jgi:hypothetical protein